jgi:glycosyltransferase involved in cell wall biosynthesis
MNVLLTHERFLPDFGGGGERIVYETARHLLRRGVQVRVVTTGDPRVTAYGGVPTVRLPVSRYRFNLALRPILDHARTCDLIHTCTYHAALPSLVAATWLRKPVLCQVLGLFDDGWKQMRGPVRGRALQAWERFLVTRRFGRTMFLSDYSRELGMALGVEAGRAVANYPGIDWPDGNQSPHKEDEVLFAGKLEARKGVDDLLAVAARLPHVRFRVVGWGPDADRFKAAATANVELAGFQEGESLRAAFARARIFFLPSKAETFGLVLAEAMASGCAIVSTIPLGYEGIHVKPGDCDAMAAAIRRLWNDRGETDRMGRRNLELGRVYTWDRYTDSLLDIYTALMNERIVAPLSTDSAARAAGPR